MKQKEKHKIENGKMKEKDWFFIGNRLSIALTSMSYTCGMKVSSIHIIPTPLLILFDRFFVSGQKNEKSTYQ